MSADYVATVRSATLADGAEEAYGLLRSVLEACGVPRHLQEITPLEHWGNGEHRTYAHTATGSAYVQVYVTA